MSDFNEDEDKSFEQIGSELVDFAKEKETSIRGLVTELFPFIYTASKRMSTRAISKYLLESQNVKLSAATIAKALREPEKHVEAFADKVEPYARRVSNAWNLTILEVLDDHHAFDLVTQHDPKIAFESDESPFFSEALGECEEARRIINSIWYAQDVGLRRMTLPYFVPDDEKEPPTTNKGK